MSSYIATGSNPQYVLPFQMDAVPSSFKSNLAPRPINCTLQTVNVPATSGNASLGTTTTIQVPLGQAAYIVNPYLRFKVAYTSGVADTTGVAFKGASKSAFALISSLQTSINSTLVDNIQNFAFTADQLLNHSSSKEWLAADGSILMNGATDIGTVAVGNPSVLETYCLPMLGMLGSQQAFPAWAVNGVLQININWAQTLAQAYKYVLGGGGSFAVAISEIAFVYDRVAVEGDFIAKMKQDMAQSGAKYCYGFTNYQSVAQASVAGQSTINTGLNVSSLRGCVMSSIATADATTANAEGLSLRAGLSNFQLTLDGRLVNANVLDAVNAPAVVFLEMNKVFSRMFDSSVTDNSTKATYISHTFLAGVSSTRISEGLAFQGSPVSVVGLQITQNSGNFTNYITYISDYQLLIGADGQCDLVR
jgi:hypothetical protein